MRIFLTRLLAPALLALTSLPALAQAQSATPDGSDLYTANCVSCHQADGKGLPNTAPALKDNAIVSGDPTVLINLVLRGPAAVLPADRPKFGENTMDSFYYKLNDDDAAAVLTYVRQTFGKDVKSPAIDAKAVAAVRAKIDPNAGN